MFQGTLCRYPLSGVILQHLFQQIETLRVQSRNQGCNSTTGRWILWQVLRIFRKIYNIWVRLG